MSEYWKSVPRKFCEFCKCWITDNKPSVDFHERGKRHQENVELKLKEVRKKSLQQSREDDMLKSQMEKMEQAALEAFKKDLKDNPDLAAQYGVSLEPKPGSAPAASASTTDPELGEKKKKKKKKVKKKEWYEAETPEGYHYFWSTVTGESKWEAPEDFMSLAEQFKAAEEADEAKKASEAATASRGDDTDKTKEGAKKHKDKSKGGGGESKPAIGAPTFVEAAQARSSAFGGWEVVKEVEQPQMYDERSAPPALDDIPLPVPGEEKTEEPEVKKPKFVIKEKVVTLGTSAGGPVAFKKRKMGGGRNVRQKGDDD